VKLPTLCPYCRTDQYTGATLAERTRIASDTLAVYGIGSPEWQEASRRTVQAMAQVGRRLACPKRHVASAEVRR